MFALLISMNLERYSYYSSKTFLDFKFENEGPKGAIKKIVRFSLQNANGITYCNLGFGDINPKTGKVDDLIISDNKDKDKILATVAAIVLDFTEKFPDMIVYAKGSTAGRTRLYQMGIAANYDQIESLLYVYGYSDGRWEFFRKRVNYYAFISLRKKCKLVLQKQINMITKSSKTTKKSKARVSRKVKDYGNEPFFVEKAKQSKAFLEKNGFPTELSLKK